MNNSYLLGFALLNPTYATDRDRGWDYKIEEVAEFLRKIPEALEKKVLIFGMTNRIDLIDRAVGVGWVE